MSKARNFAPCLMFACFVACSSSSSPTPEPTADPAAVQPGGLVGEEFEGTVDTIRGTISFRPVVRPSLGTLREKGFKQVNGGNFQFITNSAVNGVSSSSPAATTTPIVDSAGCSANQFCAQIRLVNLSGQDAKEVWVEVTSLTPDAGTVTIPSNGDSSLAPLGYSTPPSGYLDFTRGAFSYKDIANNANADHNWRFNLSGGATTFTFKVRVLATFARTSYSVVATKNASVSFNACTSTGTTGTVTTIFNNSSTWNPNNSSQIVTLPFPFTIFDTTSVSAYVTTNGVFGFGTAQNTGSSGTIPSCNSATPPSCSPTTPPKPAIFPLWDNLTMRLPSESAAGGGACYAQGTATASGARQFIVTWREAAFTSSHDSTSTDGSKLTFSLRLTEFTDDFEVLVESATMCNTTGCSKSCNAQTDCNGGGGGYRCVEDSTLTETNCTSTGGGVCHCRPMNRLAGSSATIGAQNSTATTASWYINNGSTSSVRWKFPTSVSSTTDLPLYLAFTASPGDPATVSR